MTKIARHNHRVPTATWGVHLLRCAREICTKIDRGLFPPACVSCHHPLLADEIYFCSTCLEALTLEAPWHCPRCHHPLPAAAQHDHLCHGCLDDPPPFCWLKTGGEYTGRLAELLQQFKFHAAPTLAAPLAHFILRRHQPELHSFAPDLIVPVPLHDKRLRDRGYNQALLLARQLGRALRCPVHGDYLQRHRPTPFQSHLSLAQRHANIQGAFTLSGTIRPQKILLIDDIVTTTATVRACSQTLRKDNHQIAVISVARATLKR